MKNFFVKSPVFPFAKFPGVDTILGPEMKSTGEVMGVSDNFGQAYAKAQMSAGVHLPRSGTAFISVNQHDKKNVIRIADRLRPTRFQIDRHARHGNRAGAERHSGGNPSTKSTKDGLTSST